MVQGDAKLHPNGLISYVPGIRSDGAPASVARAWGAGRSERNGVPNSDDEEAELDQLLTGDGNGCRWQRSRDRQESIARQLLPREHLRRCSDACSKQPPGSSPDCHTEGG